MRNSIPLAWCLTLLFGHCNAWLIATTTRKVASPPRQANSDSNNDGDIEHDILFNRASWVDAAATVTKDTCKMIGVKSLGVDYGLVRTGLAITSGYEAKPLLIIDERDSTEVANEVARYAASNQVDQVVLGLPLHKNGTEAPQTNLTRMFATELKRAVVSRLGPRIPLFFQDERYTSKEAKARAHAQVPGQQLYGMLDAEAASIILETFYGSDGIDQAEQVILEECDQQQCLNVFKESRLRDEEARRQLLDKRDSNLQARHEMMERAKRMEDEMRAQGTLGTSHKKKKRKKKKKLKGQSGTKWTPI